MSLNRFEFCSTFFPALERTIYPPEFKRFCFYACSEKNARGFFHPRSKKTLNGKRPLRKIYIQTSGEHSHLSSSSSGGT